MTEKKKKTENIPGEMRSIGIILEHILKMRGLSGVDIFKASHQKRTARTIINASSRTRDHAMGNLRSQCCHCGDRSQW